MARNFILATLAFSALTNCSASSPNAVQDSKERWITEHGNDPKALDGKYGIEAQSACSSKADDYLRSIARYDFAWDESAQGMLGYKFNKFSTQSPGVGMLTMISDRAKLSNDFGAFEHINLFCLYNVYTNEVVRFEKYDPYLDTLDKPSEQDKNIPKDSYSQPEVVIYRATEAPSPESSNKADEPAPFQTMASEADRPTL